MRRRIPIDDDFYATRRHIYNLYPLLIHLTIFGSKYLPPLHESARRRFSFYLANNLNVVIFVQIDYSETRFKR